MADASWWQLLATSIGGGATVKLLDIAYAEYRSRKLDSVSATEFVDAHLDPLLKAADELVGKLRALAEEDFRSVIHADLEESALRNHEFGGIVYLFGRFWAQVEIIRREGISVAMSLDDRGWKLQKFLDCLEARGVRLLQRIQQRAVGEVFLTNGVVRGYTEFVEHCENSSSSQQWIEPLALILSRLRHTNERQNLLRYFIVLHAMIDTLDPKHLITRARPSVENKLSKKSWSDLNYRIFRVYLKFVTDRQKYIGPPRKAALKRLERREETLDQVALPTFSERLLRRSYFLRVIIPLWFR